MQLLLSLPSLVLLMHHLEIILRLVNYLLDISLYFIACLLTRKLLCFDQSLDPLLRQSYMLSQLLVLSRNTRIASAVILAFSFILRSLSSVTMLKQYALFKVILIASKQSCDILISIKCGFAKRLILVELLLNRSLLLTCLLTALQSCFFNRNIRTLYASLA
jgi:hypothetical protein